MKYTLSALVLLLLPTAAVAQSSVIDGRDGPQLGRDLYEYRGDREGIMRELGRGGGMSFGMGGGEIPGYQDTPRRTRR